MAVISITIPDTLVTRVVNGVAYQNGWTAQVPDPNWEGPGPAPLVPNPVTRAQYARQVIKEWVKANVVAYEAVIAAESARAAARDQALNDITLDVT